jgi:diguanylate cyclase (GGDEF)-like protein
VAPTSRLSFLVVDPDAIGRVRVARILEGSGLAGVVVALDALGPGVLAELSVDCVVATPDDAFAAMAHLDADGPRRTAVVVVTPRAEERRAVEAIARGAEEVLLAREMDDRALLRAVKTAVRRRESTLAREVRVLRLARLAETDPLTGLLNRNGLERGVRDLAEGGCALLADVDDFKHVNDTLGHAGGDLVLQEIGAALRQALRAGDLVARIGGDEFLAVLPGCGPEEGGRLAERVRERVSAGATARAFAGGRVPPATVSIAVAPVPAGAADLAGIVASCAGSLRRSKAGGKDRVTVRDADAPPDEGPLLGVLPVVRSPVRDLVRDEHVAHEYRVRPPTGFAGTTSAYFRRCAEAGTLEEVDRRAVAARLAAVPPGRSWAILPVFPTTLTRAGAESLLDLAPPGLARERVCFGVSMKRLAGSPDLLASVAGELQRVGHGLALLDVGYGSTPIEALVCLEPRVVRLEAALTRELSVDPGRARALRRLLAALQALGAVVVAEAPASSLAVLRDLGVTLAQVEGDDEPVEGAARLVPAPHAQPPSAPGPSPSGG